MIYKKFQDLQLSSLGMGCMRLPLIDGEDSKIDVEKTEEMIRYAMENGVNYYDTAWPYHGGNSETVMGEILSKYPRDSFYLATKFPGFDLSNMGKVKEIFPKQLEKLKTDYFDFYLFHNVCEKNVDLYLDSQYGVYDYLIKMRDEGKIRHLGFSAHGDLACMRKFLDAYGKDMEFCQIQLNRVDWILQDAKGKIDLLNEYNIPVWVMEPVRGGKLAEIQPEYKKFIEGKRDIPDVEWNFRFLQSIPEVIVTLSGMSNFDQLKQNIEIFNTDAPLNADEFESLMKITKSELGKNTLPCTACRYCTSHCPMELDIPELISRYNEDVISGGGFMARMYMESIPENRRPSACIGCKSCEAVCPQGIAISEMMSDFTERLK